MRVKTWNISLLRGFILVLVLGINILGVHRQACAVDQFQTLSQSSQEGSCHKKGSQVPKMPMVSTCCLEERNAIDNSLLNEPTPADLPLVLSVPTPTSDTPEMDPQAGLAEPIWAANSHSPPPRDLFSVRLN